ncbi:MAG TPA: phosphoadenosine phosphosulfate reductase family protein [Firmicutes bacterium]|nr:phosphoadenosine phosphosulfate reductase family protein [Bacillota bacterium]
MPEYEVVGSSWFAKVKEVPGYPHLRIAIEANIINRKRLDMITLRALKTIQEWLSLCNCPSVSFSCGKDSTVVAHLARRLKPDIIILRHSSAEAHLPDVVEMMQYWRDELGANIEEFVFGSLFEWYRKYGLDSPSIDRLYKKRVSEYERARGIDGAVRGVRAEESAARRNLAKYSKRIRQQNGIWICDPIIGWTSDDVWAYIMFHRLPYAQLYDLPDSTPREKRRLGSVFGVSAAQYGRLVWLKKYYPELYGVFLKEFPEVSKYV